MAFATVQIIIHSNKMSHENTKPIIYYKFKDFVTGSWILFNEQKEKTSKKSESVKNIALTGEDSISLGGKRKKTRNTVHDEKLSSNLGHGQNPLT